MGKPWERSVRASDIPDADDSGQRPCARDLWCADPLLTRQSDGTWSRSPALGYRAFCDRDRGLIVGMLSDLPAGYLRLQAEAHEMRMAGDGRPMPSGPSLPLHEGMDALRGEMALKLGTWHARVAAIAQLTPPSARAVLAGGVTAVASAAATLGAHIDAMLALAPSWMRWTFAIPVPRAGDAPARDYRNPFRGSHWTAGGYDWLPSGSLADPRPGAEPIPAAAAEVLGACEIVRAGADFVTVLAMLDGADAGLDVFSLHRRSELLLGEVRRHADILEGVPCRRSGCEDMALERAEPPADPSQPAMYSVCAACRDMMSLEDYREWAAWYAKWADGMDLACRRCERGLHEECIYARCKCRSQGHHAFLAA